jgi:hypothetical protein
MNSLFADRIGLCEKGLHFPGTAFGQRRLYNTSHGLCSVSPCWKTPHALRPWTGISATYLLERKVFRTGTTAES